MKNSIQCSINRKEVSWILSLDSKYTIIQGLSATGKTSLIEVLQDKETTIRCPLSWYLLPRPINLSKRFINDACLRSITIIRDTMEPTLFFADEDSGYLHYTDFQKAIQYSPHLFILSHRLPMDSLPYSHKNIKCFEYDKATKTNYLVDLYPKYDVADLETVTAIRTEDFKSGLEFFKSIWVGSQSCKGVTNIHRFIKSSNNTLFVADGLGIGSEIEKISKALKANPTNQLFLLDSFEALLYNSEFINGDEKPDIFCGNCEQKYTELLESITRKSPCRYGKGKLSSCYMEDCCSKEQTCKWFKAGNKKEIILSRSELLPILEWAQRKQAEEEHEFAAAVATAMIAEHAEDKTPNIEAAEEGCSPDTNVFNTQA